MRLLIVMSVMLFSVIVFGQDADLANPDWIPVDPALVPPSWLESFLLTLNALPLIGPVIVKVAEWAGVLSVIVTSFAGAAVVSLRALSKVLTVAGLADSIPKVEAIANPVIYWLKYFSNFNVQKK